MPEFGLTMSMIRVFCDWLTWGLGEIEKDLVFIRQTKWELSWVKNHPPRSRWPPRRNQRYSPSGSTSVRNRAECWTCRCTLHCAFCTWSWPSSRFASGWTMVRCCSVSGSARSCRCQCSPVARWSCTRCSRNSSIGRAVSRSLRANACIPT